MITSYISFEKHGIKSSKRPSFLSICFPDFNPENSSTFNILIFLFLFFAFNVSGKENKTSYEYSHSGSVGGQFRDLFRRDVSPDVWNDPVKLSFVHGNFNPKFKINKATSEASVFYRRADTKLYRTNTLVKESLLFPKDLMAREIFDLTKHKSVPTYRSDLILHKFSYLYEWEKFRFEIGRFFINYGLGETFNPINPFSLPTGLFVINDISQASDGARATWFYNNSIDFNFYTLGSKDYNDINRSIHPTFYAQMEIRVEDMQFNLSGGLDQRRKKLGGQFSYSFTDYLGFMQAFYQSRLDNHQGLCDFMFGLDRQVTQFWHTRLEMSYQQDDKGELISTRFLPQEYTIALAQEFEVHSLVKLKPIFTFDPETDQTFGIFKTSVSATQNFDIEAYGMHSLINRPRKENIRQRLASDEIGLRGQYFF